MNSDLPRWPNSNAWRERRGSGSDAEENSGAYAAGSGSTTPTPTGPSPIAEIQAGMEWTSALRAINAEVFSQVLFECQFWNSVDPTDVDLEQEFGTTRLNTSSLRSDVDFIGLTWSMGFRR